MASLQVLVIVPFVSGATQALSAMIARQITLHATGSGAAASAAGLITLIFASYFSSLSIKFDRAGFLYWKEFDRTGLITLILAIVSSLIISAEPVLRFWSSQAETFSIPFWGVFFSLLLSLIPAGVMEWMKLIKDESADRRDQI